MTDDKESRWAAGLLYIEYRKLTRSKIDRFRCRKSLRANIREGLVCATLGVSFGMKMSITTRTEMADESVVRLFSLSPC